MSAGPLSGVRIVGNRRHRPVDRMPRCCWPTSEPTSCVSSARRASRLRRQIDRCHEGQLQSWTAVDRGGPEAQPGVVTGARSCERGGGADRGFPTGRHGAAGAGSDVCLATESASRSRTHDWLGQTGPLAKSAGHDINYIALSGMLHRSPAPVSVRSARGNAVGDMGGGGSDARVRSCLRAVRGEVLRSRAGRGSPRCSKEPLRSARVCSSCRRWVFH